MADNVAITAGSGSTIAADELTINAVLALVQRMKLVAGKDGTYVGDVSGRNVDGDANASAIFTDNRPNVTRKVATSSGLTIATTAYTSGDQLGALMSVTNAVRATGGTGVIQSIVLVDAGDVLGAVDIVFFRSSVTLAGDNAAWSVSDADMLTSLGLVSMPAAVDVGANRISTLTNIGLNFDLAATTLFFGLITRSANAIFTAVTDIQVALMISQD